MVITKTQQFLNIPQFAITSHLSPPYYAIKIIFFNDLCVNY